MNAFLVLIKNAAIAVTGVVKDTSSEKLTKILFGILRIEATEKKTLWPLFFYGWGSTASRLEPL